MSSIFFGIPVMIIILTNRLQAYSITTGFVILRFCKIILQINIRQHHYAPPLFTVFPYMNIGTRYA